MHDCRNILLQSVESAGDTPLSTIVNGDEVLLSMPIAAFDSAYVSDATSCVIDGLIVTSNTDVSSTATYDSNLFTLDDGAGTSNPVLTASATNNNLVKAYDSDGNINCDLTDPDDKECTISFKVEVLTKNGTVTMPLAEKDVEFKSECYLLADADLATKLSYW